MNWTILAVLLMIPGAAGLGWGSLQQRDLARRTALAARAVAEAPSADEYTALYMQWSELSPLQKAETPWGQGRYGGPEMQKRLREHQSLRFEADLFDLDSGLKSYPTQLAEVLYGADWSRRLADFQRQQEIRELITTGSGIVLFAGGLLFCGGLVKCVAVLILRKKQDAEASEKAVAGFDVSIRRSTTEAQPVRNGTESESDPESAVEPEAAPSDTGGYFGATQKKPHPAAMPRLSESAAKSEDYNAAVSLVESPSVSQEHSYFGWAMETEQNEDAVVSTLMTTQPITHELNDLTEEVSAIRQYAAAQQDQIRKFQDGYDWMIIRRFCLRIIRCIDNLEDRLARLEADDGALSGCLEDIRDELIFALESSGVEQFNPDLKTPFKGLEKYVEAVRPRVAASDAALAGTIAEIVRPGYQYLVCDDDVKIVRCAQVKLYEAEQPQEQRI